MEYPDVIVKAKIQIPCIVYMRNYKGTHVSKEVKGLLTLQLDFTDDDGYPTSGVGKAIIEDFTETAS
jgi:hypothetical protein